MLSVRNALGQAAKVLGDNPNAKNESLELLSMVRGDSLAGLLAWTDRLLSPEESKLFAQLVARRESGEPLAYIVGYKGFYDLDFIVTKDTLIPRPETELLVDKVLEKTEGNLDFLDIGTGSGAIAITVAKHQPTWRITGTDISSSALDVAKRNAEKLNIQNISWKQGNLFEALSGKTTFDVIVSNPPYIDENDSALERNVVDFEPRQALISPDNGLAHLKSIITGAKDYLKRPGLLFLEHGYQQGQAVAQLLKAAGYTDVDTLLDLNAHPRVSLGRLV